MAGTPRCNAARVLANVYRSPVCGQPVDADRLDASRREIRTRSAARLQSGYASSNTVPDRTSSLRRWIEVQYCTWFEATPSITTYALYGELS